MNWAVVLAHQLSFCQGLLAADCLSDPGGPGTDAHELPDVGAGKLVV